MKLDQTETRLGWTWLLVAGGFALALSFALYSADRFLIDWDREEKLAETLRELRTAQFVSGTGIDDVRLLVDPTESIHKDVPSHVNEKGSSAKHTAH